MIGIRIVLYGEVSEDDVEGDTADEMRAWARKVEVERANEFLAKVRTDEIEIIRIGSIDVSDG